MTIDIPANDHGHIRVFATDMALPKDVIDKTPAGLMGLFGAALDPTYIDIVRISDLGDMTLSGYIAEGYDMVADAADKPAVDGIKGTAILILSRATSGVAVTLDPAPGISHVTTFSPTAQLSPLDKINTASAKSTLDGAPAKPPKSNARIGGMVAMYALLFMFAFVALIIWIGG